MELVYASVHGRKVNVKRGPVTRAAEPTLCAVAFQLGRWIHLLRIDFIDSGRSCPWLPRRFPECGSLRNEPIVCLRLSQRGLGSLKMRQEPMVSSLAKESLPILFICYVE